MMPEPTLLPCPFCGDDTKLQITCADPDRTVACYGCGANGPWMRGRATRRKAAEAWNRRAPVGQWEPIETAPKDGSVILVARDMGDPWGFVRGYARWESVVCDLRYGTDPVEIAGWISQGLSEPPGNLGLAAPTHWMPIPAAPEKVSDAET